MNSNACACKRMLSPGVLLLLITAVLLAGCDSSSQTGKKGRAAAPATPVAVQTVKPGAVDVYATYPGRIRGAREVKILSRVEGILLKRYYNEGEYVEKGELLVTIDPRPFEATVAQRKAELAKAQAKLNQAQQAWQRISKLYQANATSEAERDQARANLQTARAAVQLAEANLEAAQIKLDYTTVEAPLSGVTSLQEVDEGALVSPGTLLTTVTQLDPVHVLFSVPAEDALMRQKALAAMVDDDGNDDAGSDTRKATLILPSGKQYPQTGKVDFTQSTIDPDTGTVRLRAIFDNSQHKLVPGRFVRIRIRLETRHNAVVIPEKSIVNNNQSSLVYVVTDDNKVEPVVVKLGPAVAGGRIIEQGLEAGDRVITIGMGSVRPGAKVKIEPASKLALGEASATAASKSKHKRDDTQASGSDSKQGH